MRNSYLRPLTTDYVDAFEKRCQTEDIPNKFKTQPDDYQKRVRRDPDDIEEDQISIAPVLERQEVPPPK